MEVTEKQIKDWKTKHGRVFKISIESKTGYFKKPGRKDLSYAYAASNGGKDPIRFNEALLNNCFLGGDEELTKDDDFAMAAGNKVAELIQTKEAELVEC